MKCQACKEQQAEWAWQPWGPGENADCFALLGSHTRGFPVVKVCASCKSAFQTGDFKVPFEYQGLKYVGQDHKVVEVDPHLWDGGACAFGHARGNGTMIMKDGPEASELVAIVSEDQPTFLPMFLASPELVGACEAVENVFRNTADYRLTTEQQLALANVHNALLSARGER